MASPRLNLTLRSPVDIIGIRPRTLYTDKGIFKPVYCRKSLHLRRTPWEKPGDLQLCRDKAREGMHRRPALNAVQHGHDCRFRVPSDVLVCLGRQVISVLKVHPVNSKHVHPSG